MSVSKTYAREVTVELVLECLMKVTAEKTLEALTQSPHVVRAVMEIARRIALLVWFGVGL